MNIILRNKRPTLAPTARAGSGLPKCSKMKFSVTEPPPNSKIPLTTPPEIQSRIFWCNKKFSENFFVFEFHRKWTGNRNFGERKW